MSLEELVSKYIVSAEHAVHVLEIVKPSDIDMKEISKVLDLAKAYLEDSKYYRDKKRFEVSLASVAYCEGLLDALKMLGAVKFEWSMKRKVEER